MPLIEFNVPFFIGVLMLVVALEQLYLLKPILKAFSIIGEKKLILISTPFILILVGCIASSVINFYSVLYSYVEAVALLKTASWIRSFFELLAFSILSTLLFIRRGVSVTSLALILLGDVNIPLLIVLAIFLMASIKHGGFEELHHLTVMIGILLLITSKLILVLPLGLLTPYGREFFSALMETFGLSNFLILKEYISSYTTSTVSGNGKKT